MNRQLVTAGVLGAIVLFFIVIGFFFVSQGQAQESINLSVSTSAPNTNTAVAFSGITNAINNGGTETTAPSPSEAAIAAIRAIPQASTFVSLLEETGVAAQLSPTGTYTFFVPTNAAFASSPLGPISDMSPSEQLRLAEFHIVSGKMMSIDAVKAGYITMLSRDELNANVFDTAQVGSDTHIIASYPAPNGIIYLIDIVLQPPTIPPFPF